MEGLAGKKIFRTDKTNVIVSGLTGLYPYLIDSWGTCKHMAPQIVSYIEEHMLNDRPDSGHMVVAAINLRIYSFLVDLPVGHSCPWRVAHTDHTLKKWDLILMIIFVCSDV